MRVLVADDDENSIFYLKDILIAMCHETISAYSGKEAIELHAKEAPDLIIVDNKMGVGYTGLDVLTIVKEKTPNCVVVIFTATDKAEIAVKAMKLGAFDYVVKGTDFCELKSVIERAESAVNEGKAAKIVNLECQEKDAIQLAINECNTFQEAAKRLGINIVTLHRKRKQYGIQRIRKDVMGPFLKTG